MAACRNAPPNGAACGCSSTVVMGTHQYRRATARESSSPAAAKPADTDEESGGASEGDSAAAAACGDISASGDEYTVEDILDCRRDKKNQRRKTFEYLVKWVGYGSEHDTWEPAAHLDGCEKLDEFTRRRQEVSQSRKRKQRQAQRPQPQRQDEEASAAAASASDEEAEEHSPEEVVTVTAGRAKRMRKSTTMKRTLSSGLNNLPTSRWVSRRSRYRGRGKRGGGLEANAEPKMGKNQPGETQRMYV